MNPEVQPPIDFSDAALESKGDARKLARPILVDFETRLAMKGSNRWISIESDRLASSLERPNHDWV
jgi:hypothetical protein